MGSNEVVAQTAFLALKSSALVHHLSNWSNSFCVVSARASLI